MSEYLQTIFDKFEFRVRKGCRYTEDGLWINVEKAKVKVGVTDFVQKTSGDVAFVELANEGSTVERQAEFGTLETAKTTVSLLAPVSGTIEQINGTLRERPELVNSDPYGEGWLIIMAPNNLENDLRALMSAEEYFRLMLKRLEAEQKRPGM